MMNYPLLREHLLKWGEKNFQDFPWRNIKDPYKILIAELMLHRTQAQQVIPIFLACIEKYPNLILFSNAKHDEVKILFYSLGLHWRVEKIFSLVNILKNDFNYEIPSQKSVLICLPGISDYIASAIMCFAYDSSEILIDTNTVRITARLLGIDQSDSLRRSLKFKMVMDQLVDPIFPQRFNYAMIDFAHKVCLPKKPDCKNCVLANMCQYFMNLAKEH